MVALHGGPGLDHTCLLPLARRLSRTFEVWLPDLPGHGRSVSSSYSEAGSGRTPGLGQVERGLGRWLRRRAPEPAILLGHSLGGWLAREIVRAGVVRPGALVLLAPPVAGREPAQDGRRSAVRRAADSRWERVARMDPAPAASALDELLSHVRSECAGQVPAELRRDLAQARLRSALDYASLLRNLHRRLSGPFRPLASPVPTLVLCGDEDRTTPPEVARRLKADRGARVEVCSGRGHYLPAQDPDGVSARVAAWWRGLASTD